MHNFPPAQGPPLTRRRKLCSFSRYPMRPVAVQLMPTPAASARALAALLALLVFGLHLLASAPGVHAWLHRAAPAHCATAQDHGNDHGAHDSVPAAAPHDPACAISLLAQGLTTPAADIAIIASSILWDARPLAPPDETPAAKPARLHPPPQAPPLAA